MKKIFLLVCAATLICSCTSTKNTKTSTEVATQTEVASPRAPEPAIKPEKPAKPTKPVVAKTKAKTMLIGKEDRTALEEAPFSTWFTPNYAKYNVNDALLPEIKKELKGVTITTFMGTWCGDSKRETPRMFKILDMASFNSKNLELITVDRTKQNPKEFTSGNNIIRVPTFIFKKDGKEIGRIVERPVESLEADMLKILKSEPYKHSYEK